MRIVCFACDCYADVAPAWEYLFHKHWPDCPYEVVFVTTSIPLKVKGAVYYAKGQDIHFGRRLRYFASECCQDDDLALMMLSDHFISGINLDLINQAIRLCSRDDVGHVRLYPMPHPQLPLPDKLHLPGIDPAKFGQIDKRRPYALSLQPGIWEPKGLAKCVRDKESPWHCETHGSGRTKRVPKMFLSTQIYAITYHNYYRGRKPQGLNWVRDNVPQEFWPDAVRKKYG